MHLVYLHRNIITNKVYIGRTCHSENPNLRWANGYGYRNQPFFEEIQKYGWENFEHIILEDNIVDEAINLRENYWIQFYQADNPEHGYNSHKSGSVSESTRQKMSDSWHKDPERAKRQREVLKQNCQNIDRSGTNNPMYGKSRSGINAGRKRKVECIETGEIFETLTDASKWCNPNGSNLKSHISEQIKGKRDYCGRHPDTKIKLHWRYIDE